MSFDPSAFPEWRAPAVDGQLLIWPDPPAIREQIRQNHSLLAEAHAVRIQNVPLPELRRRQRAWVGHANDEQPLLAGAHQVELYHPGVWAKDVLIAQIGSRVDGGAY